MIVLVFFFGDTPTTDIHTLSLHDALPIFLGDLLRPREIAEDPRLVALEPHALVTRIKPGDETRILDRKSTRLNSSHVESSYAVFCLKKKKPESKKVKPPMTMH